MKSQNLTDRLQELLQLLVSESINLIPKLLIGLLVIFIGFLVARLLEKLVTRIIIYLDRKLNAQLRNKLLTVDLRSSAIFISKTVFWIIILFAIAMIAQILKIPVFMTWLNSLLDYLPNILASVIIVLAGIVIGRLIGDLLGSAMIRSGISNEKHLSRMVQILVVFIASVIAADELGIDVQFLTNLIIIIVGALLFGASLAFGLGARTSVSNILGSYYLQKTYKEGDNVRIGDLEGVIVKITTTAVYLRVKHGQVTIPAKEFNEAQSILIKEQ